jgi:hypothetical protein
MTTPASMTPMSKALLAAGTEPEAVSVTRVSPVRRCCLIGSPGGFP